MLTLEKNAVDNTTPTTAALNLTAKAKVVLNDNAKSTKNTKNSANFVSALAYAHKSWVQNTYNKSNNELYKLLAECYASYLAMWTDSTKAKELRAQLESYISANNIVFKKSTHTLVKIIKCVFGETDKRRVSTYGIVLRTALANNLKASEIAAFIKTSGGVQEIKLAKGNALTAKAKAEAVLKLINKKVLAEVTSESIAQSLDASKVGQQVVFIATQKANGKFVISAATNSVGAVNTALTACYSPNKAKISNQKATQKVAVNDAAIHQAISLAA